MSGLKLTMPKGREAELKKKNLELAASTRGSTMSVFCATAIGADWEKMQVALSSKKAVEKAYLFSCIIFSLSVFSIELFVAVWWKNG